MSNTPHTTEPAAPADPYLEPGPEETASDMRVVSGYPIWNLIGAWMTADHSDAEVIDAYGLDPREWDAAKRYYLDHQAVFDARLIRQFEPKADDLPLGLSTAEAYFAWVAHQARRAQH